MKKSPLKRKTGLKRGSKPMRKRTPKRAKADAEYGVRRKRFLEEHPYCQWWIRENMSIQVGVFGFESTENLVIDSIGQIRSALGRIIKAPPSSQIHHMRKPKSKYLNDESTWMAVSREGHEWIERHKNLARERGYLYNI
jgi:hypothetical protein